MNKTFRALIADEEVQRIRLSTNDGLTGYKIKKLQLMYANPGTVNNESVVKVFTVPTTTATAPVDFNDPTLIATAFLTGSPSIGDPKELVVIIDDIKFNQDLYITHVDTVGTESVNYYVELEQVKLDLNEATVATLKDMRGRE